MLSSRENSVDSELPPIVQATPSESESGTEAEEYDSEEDVDPDFLTKYLRDAPPYICSMKLEASMRHLVDAAETEACISQPVSKVLTVLSEALFDVLSDQKKRDVRKRHRIPENKAAHLIFVDRQSMPLTHFPKTGSSTSARHTPEIVAVFNADDTEPNLADRACHGIPWHRVEGIVEVPRRDYCQVENYASCHHQARPDRPMVYCLIAEPECYQVMLSSPAGVVYSPQTPWAVRHLLAAYIYSHYDPPPLHFLFDETISWNSVPRELDPPSWTIKFDGKTYTDGNLMFIGDPWNKRTTVLQARDEEGNLVVLKETYHGSKRRWSEEHILEHIHADGDVPGVVRMRAAEKVVSQGDIIQCGNDEEETLKIKRRLEFLDIGEHPLRARSVNDLLKAFYDVLETHRTLYMERKVLHRDMSVNNIRIYPKWAKLQGRTVLKSAPSLITDVLNGARRPLDDLTAEGLVIDVEYAALLTECRGAKAKELTARIGTPTYIARSVCLGDLLTKVYVLDGVRMPNLEGEALRLYVQVYGEERYNKYNEKTDRSIHGGTPPPTWWSDPEQYPTFTHRPEHDVESIFWSMLTTFLRVRPPSTTPETAAPRLVALIWEILRKHAIVEDPIEPEDRRDIVFGNHMTFWYSLFLPEMRDVAQLFGQISKHIQLEYARWTGELHRDHLHEAVQRLILQYLVDHHDRDIPLDPDLLRPTKITNPYKGRDSESTTGSDIDGNDEDTLEESEESHQSATTESYGHSRSSASASDSNDSQDMDEDEQVEGEEVAATPRFAGAVKRRASVGDELHGGLSDQRQPKRFEGL